MVLYACRNGVGGRVVVFVLVITILIAGEGIKMIDDSRKGKNIGYSQEYFWDSLPFY